MLVMDEPEAGLHPLALREVARGLTRWLDALGLRVLLASHAPEFLDLQGVEVWAVTREQELSEINPVNESLWAALAEGDAGQSLGLNPADQLLLVRLFVLVEGAHDEAVARVWLDAELAQARASLLCMRGTNDLPRVLDAQLLLRATQARVLVILDNTRDELREAWDQVRQLPAHDALRHLKRTQSSLLANGLISSEEKALFELLTEAVRTEHADRLDIHGLSEPDIICYIPLDRLGGRPGQTWEDVKRTWDGQRSIKDAVRPKVRVSTDALAEAAKDVQPHAEWVALGRRLAQLADGPLVIPTARDWEGAGDDDVR